MCRGFADLAIILENDGKIGEVKTMTAIQGIEHPGKVVIKSLSFLEGRSKHTEPKRNWAIAPFSPSHHFRGCFSKPDEPTIVPMAGVPQRRPQLLERRESQDSDHNLLHAWAPSSWGRSPDRGKDECGLEAFSIPKRLSRLQRVLNPLLRLLLSAE